ncbi:hypothetical protein KCV07_g3774, partial [Aureobasidium melanogenum]
MSELDANTISKKLKALKLKRDQPNAWQYISENLTDGEMKIGTCNCKKAADNTAYAWIKTLPNKVTVGCRKKEKHNYHTDITLVDELQFIDESKRKTPLYLITDIIVQWQTLQTTLRTTPISAPTSPTHEPAVFSIPKLDSQHTTRDEDDVNNRTDDHTDGDAKDKNNDDDINDRSTADGSMQVVLAKRDPEKWSKLVAASPQLAREVDIHVGVSTVTHLARLSMVVGCATAGAVAYRDGNVMGLLSTLIGVVEAVPGLEWLRDWMRSAMSNPGLVMLLIKTFRELGWLQFGGGASMSHTLPVVPPYHGPTDHGESLRLLKEREQKEKEYKDRC